MKGEETVSPKHASDTYIQNPASEINDINRTGNADKFYAFQEHLTEYINEAILDIQESDE